MSRRSPIVTVDSINTKEALEAIPDYNELPVVATRNFVLFPGVSFPIQLTREASIRVCEAAEEQDFFVAVVCQKDPEIGFPTFGDLYDYGVVARVMKVIELPDGEKTAILAGASKIKLKSPVTCSRVPGELAVAAIPVSEQKPRDTDPMFVVMLDMLRNAFKRVKEAESDERQPDGMDFSGVEDPVLLVNLISTNAPVDPLSKLEMLRKRRIKDRTYELLAALDRTEQILRLRDEVRQRTHHLMSGQQRRQLLQTQYDALRAELFGAGNDDDLAELSKRAESVNFPDSVRKTFRKELDKLTKYPPQSPDYATQYSYLDLLLSLPWGTFSDLNTDFKEAENVLDRDHYGLEKVKERVLEQLAVMMNTPDAPAPIICLVGAPGVGKTSLGQSIASALGRKYQRVSLGGVHDESEIRGHRRTYIGAMPGRIIDAIKRSGTSNPVLLLDEIDKLGDGVKGDPSSALLEVLDPEQNVRFHDNYVDIDYDLSKVLFIATANTLASIQQPLLDRMEVIDISGYLPEEKVEIARRHLIPRAAEANGFRPDEVTFEPDALMRIIESYTAESGVRQLEKSIKKVLRAIVLRKMRGSDFSLTVSLADVRDMLGVARFTPDRYEVAGVPGVAVGLAWTAVGGEILFIEASFTPGKGDRPTLTGNLGDVMKESAVIAMQVVRKRVDLSGRDIEWLDSHSLHVHVPEGAIPKDGPSAGITLATAVVSALSGVPVRERLAMTGELTLRGKVLPVGGIKEKILAAKRAGISDIILCEDNRKDLEEIRPSYLEGVTFHFVKTITDVWAIALPGLQSSSK